MVACRSNDSAAPNPAVAAVHCKDVAAVYHVSGTRPTLIVEAYVVDLGALKDVSGQNRRGSGARKVGGRECCF